MKTLLNEWFKFRSSNAMDSKRLVSQRTHRRITGSPELKAFEQASRYIDEVLTPERPLPDPPALLHRSIMNAVDASNCNRGAKSDRWRFATAAAAIGLLTAIVAVLTWQRSPRAGHAPVAAEPGAAVLSILQASGEMGQSLPGQTVAPLSRELQFVDSDVRAAADFVVASLP